MPLPLHSLHQELSLPLVSATPRSILVGNHRSPKPTIHPNAFSAAKLVASDSVHVGDHGGYPRVRLDLLSTPMFSDHQGTPPFAGNPRRSSASVRSEGDDAHVDWSNLTSGLGGPTVSDPAPVHAGVSGNAFPECAFDVYIFETFSFLFLFY